MIRTGLGVDVHAFTEGDHLVLGGVTIPHTHAIAGYSDGDVIIHAIVDAVLGAVARGDIGTHFPSSDPQWKDVSSRLFLERVREILTEEKASVQHVDCTVILQEPKLAPYIEDMRINVSESLGIRAGQVSIKATTTDHIGFTGRQEGIAAIAAATLLSEDT